MGNCHPEQDRKGCCVPDRGPASHVDIATEDTEAVQLTTSASDVDEIVERMQTDPDDVDAQVRSCTVLTTMAQESICKRRMIAAGIVETLTASMLANIQEVGLQCAACAVLKTISSLQEGQDRMKSARVVDVVLKSMSTHKGVLDVQSICCEVLANLPHILLQDPRFTVGDEIITAVASAMVRHPRDSSVQENACIILWWSASQHETGLWQVVSCGGFGSTLTAMSAFPNEINIQRLGCGIILMAIGSSQFQKFAVDMGGLSRVIEALKVHPGDLCVTRRVLSIICTLGTSQRFVEDMIEAGTLDVVLRATPLHRKQASVQEDSCKALSILLQDNKLARAEVIVHVAKEMVSLLVNVDDLDSQEGALCVIRLLCHHQAPSLLVDSGILEAVILAMQASPEDSKIQEIGQSILDILAAAKKNLVSPGMTCAGG